MIGLGVAGCGVTSFLSNLPGYCRRCGLTDFDSAAGQLSVPSSARRTRRIRPEPSRTTANAASNSSWA
jgi:hypothetical protein